MRASRPRHALSMLLLSLCLGFAFGLAGCGDDGDETASTDTTVAKSEPSRAAGANPDRTNPAKGGGGSKPGDATRPAARPAEVDLSTDPSRIEGAVVTSTGAVQTLPPSAKAHRTAQHNSYGSIKSFGSEAEGDEATEITFALVQYLAARAQGDWATACARLYGVLRGNLEELNPSSSCPQAYGALMSRIPGSSREEAAEIDVSSVRRDDGDRAFVIYKTPNTLSADMPMYLEDGAWRVGAVDAYALEPGQGE